MIHRSCFVGIVGAALMLVAPGLRAELRVASTVEVKAERPKDRGPYSVMLYPMPVYLVKGKANIVTTVARGQVRIEGLGPVLGLDPGTVVLSRPNGEIVYLLPASRTFFKTPMVSPAALAPVFNTTQDVRSRGKSDVILGQSTERIVEDIRWTPGTRGGNMEYAADRFGRSVEAWTLDETPEQRTERFLRRGSNPRDFWEPVRIDSWISDGFGPAAAVAAQSGASITALATAGFAVLPDRKFPLRQVITNPGGGYRVESRVTAIAPISVTDELFEIPAGYREVKSLAAPALR